MQAAHSEALDAPGRQEALDAPGRQAALDAPGRQAALDALRGLAVLGMVLSGSIGFGPHLPGWMYHAQVPPPLFRFAGANALPGLTWVDLVFPAFLFAMGAAIPLAARGQGVLQGAWTAVRRGALLLGFALFVEHMKAARISSTPEPWAQGLSLLAFVLLGLMLVRATPRGLRLAAFAGGAALLALLPFADGQGFKPQRQDIILVVLANMALFGGLLWWATRRWPMARWAVCLGVVAVMLSPSEAWTRAWLDATPAGWAYRFVFLKYLLVVVPGLWLGEVLARAPEPAPTTRHAALAGLALALVVLNLVGLYTRATGWNALLSTLGLAAGCGLLRGAGGGAGWLAPAWRLASLLMLVGLFIEPLQGGIRKDPSTFSYQLVGAGCAVLLLVALQGLQGSRGQALLAFLAGQGRNPLLAYVAGSLCVLPLLHLSGLHAAWAGLNTGWFTALLKGLLFTGAVAALTACANRYRWVWRS
ncbi:MAG: DUF5009 domain-containing protein [Burkholderiales bacterium]|nr:DUF5009 domain-containing protein [Burkholderiales bacterium]